MAMPRFRLISEVEARGLADGTSVELEPGGLITPLARETLAARHVTVVPLGATDPALPADLAPRADVRRVAVGADHTGVALKAALVSHLRGQGRQVVDCGTDAAETVDYPDIAERVGRLVSRGEADGGIVIDGAGIGSAVAANKIRGVRAALCLSPTLARYARAHNGTNVLTLGATLLTLAETLAIVDTWLTTP